jgi:prepilin-type N-terminal cleavage/methylation domain-containing protein
MTRRHRAGFTLAELLVVVAIIAVLVGVSVPIFKAQKEKAVIATNQANIRNAKGVAATDYATGTFIRSTTTDTISNYGVIYAYNISTGSIHDGTMKTIGLPYDFYFNSGWVNETPQSVSFKFYIDRIKSYFSNTKFMKDGVYQYVLVFVSTKGEYTCPYYDDNTKKIVYDWES